MLSGDLKSRIAQIWSVLRSGGIANPIEVIEQIAHLLFLRRLDALHTLEEDKAISLSSLWRGATSPKLPACRVGRKRLCVEGAQPWHVQWLQNRQHHAAHQQHEHVAALSRPPRSSLARALCQKHGLEEGRCRMMMVNPPFAVSQDDEDVAMDLQPGSYAAHNALRNCWWKARRSKPSSACRSACSSAIRLSARPSRFHKNQQRQHKPVWFYDCTADGFSLDDKRKPLVSEDKIGRPPTKNGHGLLSIKERFKNDLSGRQEVVPVGGAPAARALRECGLAGRVPNRVVT